MTPSKAFVMGALSKTMATVVTYPYILAKTRLQAKLTVEVDPLLPVTLDGNGEPVQRAMKEKYSGAIDCLKQVMLEKGLGGWYQVRITLLLRLRSLTR